MSNVGLFIFAVFQSSTGLGLKKTIVEKTVSSYEKDYLLTAKVKITKDQRVEFFNRECLTVSRSPLAQWRIGRGRIIEIFLRLLSRLPRSVIQSAAARIN